MSSHLKVSPSKYNLDRPTSKDHCIRGGIVEIQLLKNSPSEYYLDQQVKAIVVGENIRYSIVQEFAQWVQPRPTSKDHYCREGIVELQLLKNSPSEYYHDQRVKATAVRENIRNSIVQEFSQRVQPWPTSKDHNSRRKL